MTSIDLRSDTGTRPSKAMLEAMMNARVGDDVFEEDETVNLLQKKCAALTGKEDALFVTSGVMGNQLAIKCHTIPGDEVIVESESHILNYETGSPAVISNVQLLPVKGDMGIITSEDIRKYVRSSEYYFPVTRLICIENTHNRAGGVIQPVEVIRDISKSLSSSFSISSFFSSSNFLYSGLPIKSYILILFTSEYSFSK